MHTFINSRAMAQMVAFDLIQEASPAEARRERRARTARARRCEARPPRRTAPGATRPRWRRARALHLLH